MDETRAQFRAHRSLAQAEAATALAAGRDRIQIAEHYQIPFPRLVYAEPMTTFTGGKKTKFKRSDQWQQP